MCLRAGKRIIEKEIERNSEIMCVVRVCGVCVVRERESKREMLMCTRTPSSAHTHSHSHTLAVSGYQAKRDGVREHTSERRKESAAFSS